VLLIGHDGHGEMYERRFGAQGVFLGEGHVSFQVNSGLPD